MLSKGLSDPSPLWCRNTPVWFPVMSVAVSQLGFWHPQELPHSVCDNNFQSGFGIHEDFLPRACGGFAVTCIFREKCYLLITQKYKCKLGGQKVWAGKGQQGWLSLTPLCFTHGKGQQMASVHFLPFSKPLPNCQISTDTLGSHLLNSLSSPVFTMDIGSSLMPGFNPGKNNPF